MKKYNRKKMMKIIYDCLPAKGLDTITKEKLNKISNELFKFSEDLSLRNDFEKFCQQNELTVKYDYIAAKDKWRFCYHLALYECGKARTKILDFIIKNSDNGLDNDRVEYDDVLNFIYDEIFSLYEIRELKSFDKECFNDVVCERLEMIYKYFGLDCEVDDLIRDVAILLVSLNEKTTPESELIIEQFSRKYANKILGEINKIKKNEDLVDESTVVVSDVSLSEGSEYSEDKKTIVKDNEKEGMTIDEKINLIREKLNKLEDLSLQEKQLLTNLDDIQRQRQQILDEISGFRK